jgi:hypothetical protein
MRIIASLIKSAAVPCGALGEAAQVEVLAVNVGDGTHPPEERRNFHVTPRLIERAVSELSHPAVLFEVGSDELRRFFLVDADLLRMPERREPVHDAEIDGLGPAAVLGGDLFTRHAENLRRSERMNVFPGAVGLDQQLVFREVREQSQLDLRIVGFEQNVSRFGNERSANLAAQFGPNGNIL